MQEHQEWKLVFVIVQCTGEALDGMDMTESNFYNRLLGIAQMTILIIMEKTLLLFYDTSASVRGV
jgi:hypothetical protein